MTFAQPEGARRLPTVATIAFFCATTFTTHGCGRSDQGPSRYNLSGTVTLQGKPVPAGTIDLQPDSGKGNKGPGTYMIIKNGSFRSPPGKGPVGGPYTARITIFDGKPTDPSQELGNPVGPVHRIEVDLPKSDATHDFKF